MTRDKQNVSGIEAAMQRIGFALALVLLLVCSSAQAQQVTRNLIFHVPPSANLITLQVPTGYSNYTLTLPPDLTAGVTAQTGLLQTNGSGVLSWLQPTALVTSTAWALAGNSITGTEVLGTTNAQDLRIIANNQVRIIVNQASGMTTVNNGLTVAAGGATVTAGGLTVNGGGATIQGAAPGDNTLTLGNSTQAGRLVVNDASAGVFSTSFTTGSQTGNIGYTLPISLTPVGTVQAGVMQTDGLGNMSWVTPSALASASAWTLTGNTGTNPATNYIGTTDAQNLSIRTNATERISINATTGLVTSTNGIGITAGGLAVTAGGVAVNGGGATIQGAAPGDNTLTIGNATQAGRLVLNDAGAGAFTTTFSTGTQTGNINYVFPTSLTPVGTVQSGVLQTDASGNMSWVTPSALASASAWTLTGNTGTNPATNYIGTTDAQNLSIRTNATERISVNATTGLVTSTNGIGITAGGLAVTAGGVAVNGGGATIQGAAPGDNTLTIGNATQAGRLVLNDAGAGAFTTTFSTGTQTGNINYVFPTSLTPVGAVQSGVLQTDASGNMSWVTPSALASASAWTLTGNTGTNPATNYIGTTDAQNLSIRTNATERISINATTGLVTSTNGIGITAGGLAVTAGGATITAGGLAVNGGGAAIQGAAAGDNTLTIGNATQAGRLVINDASAGAFTSSFTTGAQTGSISYVLPTSLTPVGTAQAGVLQTDGSGNMSWVTPSALANASAWTLTGNTGTNPATNYIGTTDAQNLSIRTNATERISINATTGLVTSTNGVAITTGGATITAGGLTVNGGGATIQGAAAGDNTLTIGNATQAGRLVLNDASAGAFTTTFSTGTQTGNINYVFPTSLTPVGTAQAGVLQTDGSGNMSWVTPSALANASAWTLTGNTGTNPATNYLGTTDANPLVIRTAATERARFGATGGLAIGTPTPSASAILDLSSTASGFLMPRMTQAQRDLIGSPATSLLIYQTDNTPGYYFYDGSNWVNFGATGWQLNGNSVGASNFLGTTNNQDLRIRAGNTQIITVNATNFSTDVRNVAAAGSGTAGNALINTMDYRTNNIGATGGRAQFNSLVLGAAGSSGTIDVQLNSMDLQVGGSHGDFRGSYNRIMTNASTSGTISSVTNFFSELRGTGSGTINTFYAFRGGVDGSSPAIANGWGLSLSTPSGAQTGTANYTGVEVGSISTAGSGTRRAFYYSGTVPFVVQASGATGIGTASPNQRLELRDGNALISNSGTPGQLQFQGTGTGVSTFAAGAQGTTDINYTLPTTLTPTGTVANGVLQTNSTGTLSWATPGAVVGSVAWLLTGNAGTNPATNYIGTSDAQNLSIRTSGSERISVNGTTGLVTSANGVAITTGGLAVNGGGATVQGAATADNTLTLGNNTQAGRLVFNDNSAGVFTTTFTTGNQGANISYTLPATLGATNTFLQNTGGGTLGWAVALTGAINGLSTVGSNVSLGGTLTSNTTIEQGAFEFNVRRLGSGGVVNLTNNGTAQQELRFWELSGNGTDYISLRAPAAIGTPVTLTLPPNTGTVGQVLTTDGAGLLSWTTPGAAGVTGAENGLSLSGANVRLGGTLITNTTVSGGTFNLNFEKSGSGNVQLTNNNNTPQELRFFEASASGTDFVSFRSPNTLASPYTLVLPVDDGSTGQILSTDGSGVLSWITSVTAANNGLTLSGSTVQLGGTLIQPTQIDLGTNNLDFRNTGAGTGNVRLTNNNNIAQRLQFFEPSSSGSNFSSFSAPAQSADINYTLPNSLTPSTTPSSAVLQTDASGNLSWININSLPNTGGGWSLTGNNINNNDFIGPINGNDFKIRTGSGSNEGERIRVSGNSGPTLGFVGINTTTPQELLDVNGDVRISNGDNAANGLRFMEPSGSGVNSTRIRAGIQTADIDYIWPLNTTNTAVQDRLLQLNVSTGQLSWVNPTATGIGSGSSGLWEVGSGSFGVQMLGQGNQAGGQYSIAAGQSNQASGGWSGTLSGQSNQASAQYSVIAGGQSNQASGGFSTIGGGQDNQASGQYSTISGGDNHQNAAQFGTISGGQEHVLSSSATYSVIAGGFSNEIAGTHSGIFSGQDHSIPSGGSYSAVLSGFSHTNEGDYSAILGGQANSITSSAAHSVVLGGENTSVSSTRSLAFGWGASVSQTNTVVFNHPTAGTPGQTRFGIRKNNPSEALDVDGNVRFSGALMPNNLPGASGAILKSAGAGTAPTWGERITKAAVNVDPPNIAANAGASVDVTVTGVGTTGSVMVSPTNDLENGITIQWARVPGAGQVRIRFWNNTGAAVNPAAQDFNITVIE